jgi:N-acyl-D-amino-acid deacylase
MKLRSFGFLVLGLATWCIALAPNSSGYLLRGGTVFDGSGATPRVADVRIAGGKIAAVGRLRPQAGEVVLDVKGLFVTPGFVDAHSHADRALEESPELESQVRQGITTAIVGQDGGSDLPVEAFFEKVQKLRPNLNFATFCGHGSLRRKVMGDDHKRGAKDAEVARMQEMLEEAMKQGALGLSAGLEYDPGYYSGTVELIELAKVAARNGGMYISHIREDGTHGMLQALEEHALVAKTAGLPAQVSHIKLAVAAKWGQANAVLKWLEKKRREGLDLTADVYPYLYWQSTITVLTLDRNWESRDIWIKALEDVGGPQNVLLTKFTPDPSWEGRTLEELARAQGKDAPDLIREIVRKTHFPDSKESESVVVTSMSEPDLEAFLEHPQVMFCSDGAHGGSHPRGAGSFPRILGRYVREKKLLSWQEAIRKATSLPASRFGLKDRGLIRPGKVADVAVFDPSRIGDRATTKDPKAFSQGMVHVFVNGRPTLLEERLTHSRSGIGLRREGRLGKS